LDCWLTTNGSSRIANDLSNPSPAINVADFGLLTVEMHPDGRAVLKAMVTYAKVIGSLADVPPSVIAFSHLMHELFTSHGLASEAVSYHRCSRRNTRREHSDHDSARVENWYVISHMSACPGDLLVGLGLAGLSAGLKVGLDGFDAEVLAFSLQRRNDLLRRFALRLSHKMRSAK
jgi:hypothetical protein